MKKETAITHFKTVRALADALGITREAIYQWGDDVPELWAYKLQCITFGAITVLDRRNRRRAVPKRSGGKQKGGGKAGVKKTA